MKILVATPCYARQITDGYFRSMLDTRRVMPEIEVLTIGNESSICRARQQACAHFLAGDYDKLFFIDADIAWTVEQFLRVVQSPKSIAAAAYPLKKLMPEARLMPFLEHVQKHGTASLKELSELLTWHFCPIFDPHVIEDGFIKVLQVGTGFMCIDRKVFDDLMVAFPELQYETDILGADPALADHWWAFFTDALWSQGEGKKPVYLTEDYTFCRRAASVGHDTWVDVQSALTHIGNFDYHGRLVRNDAVEESPKEAPPVIELGPPMDPEELADEAQKIVADFSKPKPVRKKRLNGK